MKFTLFFCGLFFLSSLTIFSLAKGNIKKFKGPGYSFQLLSSGNQHFVKFQGKINYPKTRKRQKEFLMPISNLALNFTSKSQIHLFVGPASGGNVIVHKNIVEIFQKQQRHLTTYITDTCQSACLDFATRANAAYAIQNHAKIYVHRGAYLDNGKVLSLFEIADYYNRMGANGQWILDNPHFYGSDNYPRQIPLRGALELGAIDQVIQKQHLIRRFGQSLANWVL